MKSKYLCFSIIPLICHSLFCGCGFDAPYYGKDRDARIRNEVAYVMKETNVTHTPVRDLLKTSSGSCNGAMVTLHPVEFSSVLPDLAGSCEKIGASAVRVWIFTNEAVVREESLPCIKDRIELGCLDEGTYYVAAIGERFNILPRYVAGMILLLDVFPDYQGCVHYDGRIPRSCAPVGIQVSGFGELVVPMILYCDDELSGGDDSCGGA